jgi:hypothetical protein
MARSKGEKPRRRTSGGFRPPELRGTLGTLWRTTLQQAGVVRDALERSAREGRSRLDEARTSRKRHDALAELGEIVLELIRNGEIDVAELPEAQDIVAHLDELDGTDDDPQDAEVTRPRSRSRFDDRSVPSDDGTVSSSRWTPPKPTTPSRIWRPPADDDTPDPRDTTPTEPPPMRKRKGGIQFGNDDDDNDLEEYMHPDDVPPKPPKDGGGSSGS